MLAFHSNPALKAKAIADEMREDPRWFPALYDPDREMFSEKFGIPLDLASAMYAVWDLGGTDSEDFLEAITPGADLSKVGFWFRAFVLREYLAPALADFKRGPEVMIKCAKILEREAEFGDVYEDDLAELWGDASCEVWNFACTDIKNASLARKACEIACQSAAEIAATLYSKSWPPHHFDEQTAWAVKVARNFTDRNVPNHRRPETRRALGEALGVKLIALLAAAPVPAEVSR